MEGRRGGGGGKDVTQDTMKMLDRILNAETNQMAMHITWVRDREGNEEEVGKGERGN